MTSIVIDTGSDQCRVLACSYLKKASYFRFHSGFTDGASFRVELREDQVFAMSLTREGLKEIWMFRIPSLPYVANSSTRAKRS